MKIGKELFEKAGKYVTLNSPTILCTVAVAGVITTAILASKASIKANEIIKEKELDKGSELKPIEKVQATAKIYAPALIMGTATIGCIIGANSIQNHRNMALAGLYATAETAVKEYQNKVESLVDSEKAKEIKKNIFDKTGYSDSSSGKQTYMIDDNSEVWCLDGYSGREFKSTKNKLEAAVNEANRRLLNGDQISLNELYSDFDLESTDGGEGIGWGFFDNHIINIDFEPVLTKNGKPCLKMLLNPKEFR